LTNSNLEPEKKDQANHQDETIVIIYDEGPGDTTVRPARFDVPREWPRPQVPKQQPSEPEKP
jgi:hypothetical protein